MKSKTTVIIVVVIVIALAAFFVSRQLATPTQEAYEKFTLVMNHLSGPGKWTDKGHKVSMLNGTLVVDGLSFTLGASSEVRVEVNQLEIASGQSKKDLEEFLTLKDWQAQEEKQLLQTLIFKGLYLKSTVGPASEEGTVPELWLEELIFKNMRLDAAGPEALKGPAGFLQALCLDSMGYKNLKATTTVDKQELELKVDSYQLTEVSFTGTAAPMSEGLDKLDPTGGFLGVIAKFSAKNAKMEQISLAVPPLGHFTVASVEQKELSGTWKAGEYIIEGVNLEITPPDEDDLSVSFSLGHTSFKDYDASAYVQKLIAVGIMASLNPGGAEDIANNFQTLADIFVFPITLDQGLVKDLKFAINPYINVEMEEALLKGPFVANQVPADYNGSLKGLVITLNESLSTATDSDLWKDVYKFGQDFGQTRFEMEGSIKGSYDPETGTLNNLPSVLTIKDLMEISYEMELTGLTSQLLETMSDIPLNDESFYLMALLGPEKVFGDLTFNNFNFKLTDESLTDRLFNFYKVASGNTALANMSIEELKTMAILAVKLYMGAKGSKNLDNPDVLTESLADFINDPGTLELSIKPDPPLNVKNAGNFTSINQMLNSLNITVRSNGQKTPALKFKIQGLGEADLPDNKK